MLLRTELLEPAGFSMADRPDIDTTALIDPTKAFEADARQVLADVRAAFGKLLESLPGETRRAAGVQRTLGLDSALAWQVHTASTVPDPLAVGRHLPGSVAVGRVLEAARGVGAPDAALEDVGRAYARFLELVERHAGDRRTFDSMLASITDSGREQADFKQRRAAFRANSHIWGLQARVMVGTCIVYPGDGVIDVMQITGAVDLRPLRPDVSIRYSGSLRVSHDTGNLGREPVTDAFLGQDPGLIEEFCTRPLPELSSRRGADGKVEITITPRGLGRSGAVTFFRRFLAHSVSDGSPERQFETNVLVTIPAELQLVDLLVPHDWVDRTGVRCECFGARHDPRRHVDQRAQDRLPAPAPAAYLGRGLDCLRVPDVAGYPALVEHVMSRLGWSADRLDAFRVLVPYPVLHASTLLTVPAAAPAGG